MPRAAISPGQTYCWGLWIHGDAAKRSGFCCCLPCNLIRMAQSVACLPPPKKYYLTSNKWQWQAYLATQLLGSLLGTLGTMTFSKRLGLWTLCNCPAYFNIPYTRLKISLTAWRSLWLDSKLHFLSFLSVTFSFSHMCMLIWEASD